MRDRNLTHNPALDAYCASLPAKRIAVLGLGISNLALIRFLHEAGATDITVYDKNGDTAVRDSAADLMRRGLVRRLVTGPSYLDEIPEQGYDLIFRSPSIRPDAAPLARAVSRGAVLTGEMEVFMALCPCKMYGVTGSDGKTTTTTLIYELLRTHYASCATDSAGDGAQHPPRIWLGGNIGRPLIADLPDIAPCDRVVLELSSFQLMTLRTSPHVAVITNITPNHLDIHKDYAEYIDAKQNIYRFRPDCRTVLNAGNEQTAAMARTLLGEGRTVDLFSATVPCAEMAALHPHRMAFCSQTEGAEKGAAEDAEVLTVRTAEREELHLPRTGLLLPGRHNAENLLAAVCACGSEIREADVRQVAAAFPGVEHRMEFVREVRGVRYYNSSIDSSPNRTAHALSVFPERVILIAGGKDKGIPYDSLGPVLAQKVKFLILIGATADRIEAALRAAEQAPDRAADQTAEQAADQATEQAAPCEPVRAVHCTTYEEAVKTAYEAANSGDVVLLSPASTSFDMFRNFEERGNLFKKLVQMLPS